MPAICGHPKNIVFLTCDAFSVLPPVSKLTPEQAIYHFYSGYTAKIAGTELGVKEPTPTFSSCFGEAFLPLKPQVYADLLFKKIHEHGVNVWLVNTGWTGGKYGIGKVFIHLFSVLASKLPETSSTQSMMAHLLKLNSKPSQFSTLAIPKLFTESIQRFLTHLLLGLTKMSTTLLLRKLLRCSTKTSRDSNTMLPILLKRELQLLYDHQYIHYCENMKIEKCSNQNFNIFRCFPDDSILYYSFCSFFALLSSSSIHQDLSFNANLLPPFSLSFDRYLHHKIIELTHMLMIICKNLSLFNRKDWINQQGASTKENLNPWRRLLMIIFCRTI